MRRIVINGKFLSAPPTGVHRVAAELANAIADLQLTDADQLDGLSFELWIPRAARARASTIRLLTKVRPMLQGIPWEQITLPLLARDTTVLSLCNIGPVANRGGITMIHDAQVHISPRSYSAPFRTWYKFIQPLLGRRQSHILTVSNYSKREIAKFGICPVEKLVVIHNGADHILRLPARDDAFAATGLAPRGYVVALSNTQAHKNIGVLLEAFADPALSALTLVLVGSATRANFVAAGMRVPANVQFTGHVSDAALRGLFEQALCLAFPSRTEGFGLPPLEAMTVGCPVVVAPCGALPEVCGEAALYADPDQPVEWIARLRQIADNPATREQLAEAGRAHAAAFTWKAAAGRLVRLLREAA